MDRTLVYSGQVPRALDNLLLGRFAMTGLAKLSEAVLGTSPVVPQGSFTVTPASGLNINVGAGQIYQLQSLEATTESALGADGHQVLKQGIALDAQTLTLAPPATVGYAQNFLVQVAYEDIPSGQVVLSFQNPTPVQDPTTGAYKYVTYPGPGGNGQSSYTILQGGVSVNAKAGVAATSGSQTTPAPDTGYVGLYVVTLAYGASSISNGSISVYGSAPFLPVTLPNVPAAVQANAWSYAVASGTNNLTATLTPQPPSLADGLTVTLFCPNANTGPVTLNINGLGASTVTRKDGNALEASDIRAASIQRLTYKGGVWQAVSPLPSELTSTVNNYLAGQLTIGGRIQPYTSPGTYTFTLPANVDAFGCSLWGAGGGGGGAASSTSAAPGGGGGDYEEGSYACQPGSTITINVGAGGTAGAAGGGNGSNGGLSSVAYVTPGGTTTTIVAGGGQGAGGSTSGSGTVQGSGGTGSGGLISRPGYIGGTAYAPGGVSNGYIGGPGGQAYTSPGAGANFGTAGNPGTVPGGGGSGSANNAAGGTGGDGVVIIRY